ncbi:MAG TPA: HlyD family efflux transporter periplasmic adaptor subunit [Nitrosomonas sp.]|jgi:membrane fusion protein|nr:HlyD family efflux transporter periplasmic adaptor subunit [Nitrosomonas sp.]HQV87787.1 HlyD family efflux transporter periplasmic adaptor subunit [Nitrosomonas sp.]
MSTPLFRTKALAHQQDRLHGEILIARSPTIRLFVSVTALFAIALVSFAFWGEYTRKEHVAGYLSPTQGMIKMYSPQVGTVLIKHVDEGQLVKQGDVLLTISSERATSTTRETQAAMLAELKQRRDSLRLEQGKQQEIDALTGTGIVGRIRGLETEIREAQAQMALQSSRVTSAERMVARYEKLLLERFVSDVALQEKQDELISQRNQLAQLKRSITSLNRELSSTRVELSTSGLKRDNNTSAIERQISELEQQLTETDARRSIVLTAPADGTVTTILVELGQTANPNTPLLSILPAGAELQAQLLVPTRAAGFIKPTQQVSLRYQAFPYQRFGHHLGEVVEIGRTVIQPNESSLPLSIQESVYRVTVRLPQQKVHAYGQAMPLQAGMVLDADIHMDRRRLIEWVFDPLLSITGRI